MASCSLCMAGTDSGVERPGWGIKEIRVWDYHLRLREVAKSSLGIFCGWCRVLSALYSVQQKSPRPITQCQTAGLTFLPTNQPPPEAGEEGTTHSIIFVFFQDFSLTFSYESFQTYSNGKRILQ